ncbi:hypothetical protein HNP84_009494 [Thermocatellispora tengchongensis]|uniref:CU044_5270 family protein n=1 Tax=Thermocatellispora tengchongensis TaxID=1073253 RepID=A0A840PPR5_9ACTN|nr:CU044_5270 family protein [Thermocatellispora tengchongensis]MBB5139730.1 hypothetical protein [Thermocatellispora tengchongensis]
MSRSPFDEEKEVHDMTDRMLAQLRPAALDELTEDAYQRRRAADLHRAFETPREPAARRVVRRPMLLITGTAAAAAGLAAAVIIVPSLGGGGQTAVPGPGATSRAPAETTESTGTTTIDARGFLLAAAETAAKEPATTGRWWYTRDRTFQRLSVDPVASEKELRKQVRERGPDKIDKQEILEKSKLPYAAFITSTDELWRARAQGDANRSTRRNDPKVTFGSPADEEKWKAAGSPKLVENTKPRTYDAPERVLSIANPALNMRNVDELPTSPEALERKLRGLFDARPQSSGSEDFAGYLWQTGVDLLSAPITPGTKAALYRVMADEPGITAEGTATDSMGRTGAVLTVLGPDDRDRPDKIRYRLLIDPETADLLQYEVIEVDDDSPLLRVTLQEAGWVNKLGKRP